MWCFIRGILLLEVSILFLLLSRQNLCLREARCRAHVLRFGEQLRKTWGAVGFSGAPAAGLQWSTSCTYSSVPSLDLQALGRWCH